MEKEKRELRIFLAIAYGVTFLMGFLMWFGNARGLDISVFPNAQMMYPAAGVALAYLVRRRQDEKVPRAFYIIYLVVTGVMVLCAVGSAALPSTLTMQDGTELSVWSASTSSIMMIGSLLCWLGLWRDGKEKRAAYGLRWNKTKTSFLMLLLFLGLYFLRVEVMYTISGEPLYLFGILKTPAALMYLVSMILNFFLVFVAFFGEEYGWRYYLQPICQKKFGLRKGVVVLGIVWGLWHMPVDFFYYTNPGDGIIMLLSQFITCITLGIFFAYAYMKTDNIWVPVALHFMNNNLIPLITGTYSADILEGQSVSWLELPIALVVNGLIFGLFLLSKTFRENRATEA